MQKVRKRKGGLSFCCSSLQIDKKKPSLFAKEGFHIA